MLKPNKAVYMGNSLLCCGPGNIGLCACDQYHDYYYLTNQTFLKRNPAYTAVRVNGADWERGTSGAQRRQLLDEEFAPYFAPDADLVILQLCDNTNEPAMRATFREDSADLIAWVKQRCPKAEILWLAGWYGCEELFAAIRAACELHGAKYIDLSSCKEVPDARGWVGKVQTFPNGDKLAISSEGAASHPGDGGMAAISELILQC